MSEILGWSGVLVLAGLFMTWLGHARFRQPDAPPIYRDPLDNPFGRREWYTDTGNRLRTAGFACALVGAAMGLVGLSRLLWN